MENNVRKKIWDFAVAQYNSFIQDVVNPAVYHYKLQYGVKEIRHRQGVKFTIDPDFFIIWYDPKTGLITVQSK